MEKLNEYTGGYWHLQAVKDAWREWRTGDAGETVDPTEPAIESGSFVGRIRDGIITRHHSASNQRDFSHVNRRKTRLELVVISAAVMGIEFCYAAETAFVSPTLLSIGVKHNHMTLIWCLSPLVGFFVTPVFGSMSDRCRSVLGRRRPFILLLSVGIVLGLILVPNGKLLGRSLGDQYALPATSGRETVGNNYTSTTEDITYSRSADRSEHVFSDLGSDNFTYPMRDKVDTTTQYFTHPWGIFFTIIGTMLLDFSSDACQSPTRAFLLDITIPEDHTRGLSTFTIMAGLGGALGYMMGATDWDSTWIGDVFGGHVRAVFSIVLVIFLVCLSCSITSFAEVPLDMVEAQLPETRRTRKLVKSETMLAARDEDPLQRNYGTLSDGSVSRCELQQQTDSTASADAHIKDQRLVLEDVGGSKTSLREYLLSILYMPSSMRILCLTNLFCWMSLVCYSLYFTDFVGEAVFDGSPQAAVGSEARQRYERGVRFGCWGLAVYSFSCSIYSFLIERLVRRFRARPVYVCGQLVYCAGMVCMAALRHPVAVIVFSVCAGVMYSTLFTMPYLLVAHYHVQGVMWHQNTFKSVYRCLQRACCGACHSFEELQEDAEVGRKRSQIRGLGTDVAIVSSMVFLAQFVLSICLGSIIAAAGTTTMVVVMAAVLSFCGALSATQVTYLDL